jgi:hypothetical protein
MLGTFLRIQKAILFFFALLCIRWLSVAQTPENFFPHRVGDFWEFFVLNGVGNDTMQVWVILDSSDENGNTYVQHHLQVINPTEPPLKTPGMIIIELIPWTKSMLVISTL